jgi:prepilin-type N-terminal cleavage/methylation domain-containing protein
MKKTNKAFSLIELSIVILIIGILIAGVVAGSRLISKSKRSTAANLTKTSIVPSIPDLVFWADAASEEAFDDSVTTNSVSTWYDIAPYSANKNNATQATAANRPTFVEGAINGVPALRFDGVNDSLAIDGNFMSDKYYSIFIVEQRRGSTSGSYFYSPSSQGLSFGYATSTEFRFTSFSGANDWIPITISAYTSPIAKIISLIGQPASDPTKISNALYFNGTLQYNDTTGRINYGNSSTYNIGKNPYQGDIGELIIFKRNVKPSERADIQEYLSKKWKIALQ